MNGHKTSGANSNRSYRTIKVAPTARAIRAALAASATMLALAGSGAALAGTCAVSGVVEVTCTGVFTDDVTNTVPVIDLVPDLTLVVGDDGTTTVDPAVGVSGITSYWGGEATVINYAEVNVSGNDGIHMETDYNGTVLNYGSIYTYANTAGDSGIQVYAPNGDITVVNGGDITAANNNNYGVSAIYASSLDGYTTITNQAGGTINASSYSGNTFGINVGTSYYGAYVDNEGEINASSFTGNATGINVSAFDGDANVVNGGNVYAYSLEGNTTGIEAFSYLGDSSVSNSGGIYVGGQGNADGVVVLSVNGTVYADNSGTIEATSYGSSAGGISAYGKYADIDNSGDITVSGYSSASGIQAYGTYGVTINSSGDVTVSASGIGAEASGINVTSTGYINIYNDGNVYVTSTGDGGGAPLLPYAEGANGVGISAISEYSEGGQGSGPPTLLYGPTDVNVVSTVSVTVNVAGNGIGIYGATIGTGSVYLANSGTVTVDAGGYAGGIVGYSDSGTIEVQNSGTVDVYGYNGIAYGVYVSDSAYFGDIYVNNSGSISAYSYYDTAGGIHAETDNGYSNVNINNSGSVYAGSYDGFAVGIIAEVTGYESDVTVNSDGSVAVNTENYAGYGIIALTYGTRGDVYVGQGAASSINVYSYDGVALGVLAVTSGYDSNIELDLDGDTYIHSVNDSAVGFEAVSAGTYSDIYAYNAGEIVVYSGTSTALGGEVITAGYDADIVFGNNGGIRAYGETTAIGVEVVAAANESQVDFANTGTISASSYSGNATGALIITAGNYGDVDVYNSGSIDAIVGTGTAIGLQVITAGDYADVYISGPGDVSAYTFSGNASGINVVVGGYDSNIYIGSGGTIDVTSLDGYARGIVTTNDTDSGYVTVDNSGTINVSAYNGAYGIVANGVGYGDTTVNSSGYISVNSSDGRAEGILAYAYAADVYIDHSGTTDVYGYGNAFGLDGQNSGDGNITILNSGSVSATSGGGYAYGINAEPDGLGFIYIDNSGTVTANSYNGNAYGIYTDRDAYGSTTIYNSGTINATAYNFAAGIQAITDNVSNYSQIDIDSSGSINAYAENGAVGISAYAGGYSDKYGSAGNYTSIDVTNSGSISAIALYGSAAGIDAVTGGDGTDIYVGNSGTIDASGYDQALGIYAGSQGKYDSFAEVFNTGDISAYAYSAGYTRAGGIVVVSNDVYAYQGGSISATAFSGDSAYAVGLVADGKYTATVNTGYGSSTSASAGAPAYAEAIGIAASSYDASVYNEGAVSASASADGGYGEASATGIAVSGYFGSVFLTGDSDVSADADGYYALAIGVDANATNLDFYNGGSIDASVSGYTGYAVGVDLRSTNSFNAYNVGSITAESEGDDTESLAVFAYSYDGSVGVFNSGTISASSDYLAAGVVLRTDYYGYVLNNGLIEGDGGSYSVAIWSQGYSNDEILNYDTINGAIWAGDGDDFFYNGEDAEWNPGQTTTYFGNGDDEIVNDGTINMVNSSIDLGYHVTYGNQFYNNNLITVSGDANYINMGSGPQALVPSLNPYAFYNYGTIDFQDGDPDDVLYITGDFAGDGDINVDVSGLDGVSDVLYIDGSVVSGTVNTINVELSDLPVVESTLIPIVYVTGVSVDGNFVLGDLNWDDINTFLTFDFGIISDIDTTNATPDVFNLGIEVSGLSDPGTTALTIGPSVQSLMNSQVGTWRQRAGVIDAFNKGGVGLWARVFSDKGSFTPEHVAGNFGNGGNFDWDQKNTGIEAGVDFAVTDEFSIGLLVSSSDADTHLDGPGVGHTDVSADTWGIYGTWISPNGFYLDASYRWMNFDVDLDSVAGSMSAEGDAEAFNIEAGYAWTLEGGLKIEPQLQYTKTSVNNIDVLVTTTGMTFAQDGGDSSRGRLGVAIRKSFGEADNGWMWTPYATLSAVREFDGESTYVVNNVFSGEANVEGTSALLELGFTARHQGWAIYGGLNWQDGGAVNSFFGGQLGVRYTFGGPAPAAPVVAPPPAKTCADLDDDGDGVNNCDDKCLSSTAGQAVGPDGCPVPLTIDLKGVNFDFDKATLRPDAVAILDEAVAILGKYPDLKVEVAGHTDSIGTEQYNQGLSERRAKTVWDYLAAHGVDAGRMVGPNGYGETRPIAPNTNEDGSDNPEGRAKNRRTELNVQN